MEKILYLEKRGLDFWDDDPIKKVSDVGNYRVTTTGETVRGKDGNSYFLEFSRWDRYELRTKNKRTGETLKKPVRELVLLYALHVDTEYTNERGSWGNISLEKRLHEKPVLYTLENILEITNEISIDIYTRIEFVER